MHDVYNTLFEKGISVNPACYECLYRINHSSDITIGDFWRYRQVGLSAESVKDGITLCVVNTQKGTDVLKSNPYLDITDIKLKYSDYAFVQRKKTSSSSVEFYGDYVANGYNYVKKKYAGNLYIRSVFSKIKSILRK